MRLKDYFKAWGWRKPPVLGDIYKNDNDLLRLFNFRKDLVEDTVFLLNNLMNTRGILVSGLPGVGKTTFLNYLRKKHFPNQMKIVSLAGRLGAVKPRDYVNVTEEQFLHIFSQIEFFFTHILELNGNTPLYQEQAKIRKEWRTEDNAIPFKEFARDILLPLCEQINKLNDIPQYFLVIDDVDYIYPTDQSEMLAVLCDLISTTSNPVILYSARPPAAGIAKNHLSTYASHHFGDPIDLEPIPAFDVVKDRLKDCDEKCGDQCGPFLCNTETRKFFLSLSNHNIRTCLDVCSAAIKEAPKSLKNVDDTYDEKSLVQTLYGRPSVSIRDEKDIDNNRHIQNIFRARSPADQIPYDYITLLSFSEPRLVNKDFVELFNKICQKINPINFPSQKSIPQNEVIKYVGSAQHHEFITRIDRVRINTVSDHSFVEQNNPGIWMNKFCLTPKGVFMLKLSKEDYYQERCSLNSYRALVATEIRNQKINIKTIDKHI